MTDSASSSPVDPFHQVLPSHVHAARSWKPVFTKRQSEVVEGVEIRHYTLTSQIWSVNGLVSPERWTHDVRIAIPPAPVRGRALVFANNGVNHPQDGNCIPPSDLPSDALPGLALATRTIIISAGNIPNQNLQYQDDRRSRNEDGLVAHGWKLFLEEPQSRAPLPLTVPMTAALSKVMSLAEAELADWDIHRFVLSGISKRAWAAWLSSIVDDRVDAVIPFAFDMVDIKASLAHIYQSFGKHWPIAFAPYYAEGLDTQTDATAFVALMRIQDPLQYRHTAYASRLAVPKYIVGASGDDFFVPDGLTRYIGKLPGKHTVRMLPNTDHRGVRTHVITALTHYLGRLRHDRAIPTLDAKVIDDGDQKHLSVSFSEKPTAIRYWWARNATTRDFRLACVALYSAEPLAPDSTGRVVVPLSDAILGWKAGFVEATFDDGFVATTPVYVTPDELWPEGRPRTLSPACDTLPGRV